ncbi:GNAT family N-acetyltransferase [Oryzobacter telluris]|uniref:GNAT family N-acetyltransferase n=1 Tax=Oryzobacter telluris TaxID=3149179 RepID=UPI00370DCC3D
MDVSLVDADDLRDITGLWLAARVDAGSSKEAAARAVTEGRLTTALRRPGVLAFVARLEGEAVGYAIATENPFGLSPTAELAIEQLWVGPDVRRHGVAKSLIGAVLTSAERAGCEIVVSNVPTTSRDANRFFARLGFSSTIVRRVVPTATLRRKLAPETCETGNEVMRRRRSLRSRAFAATRTL